MDCGQLEVSLEGGVVMVAGDEVEELLGGFGKGSVGVERSLRLGEEENEGEKKRSGEKQWPEIGEDVEEPRSEVEHGEDREGHEECHSDVVPELQQVLLDLHGKKKERKGNGG